MSSFDPFDGQPFTSLMARAGGISRHQVRDWVSSGRLRVVLYGVYVGAAAPDSVDLRARAAALVLPEHAVVSDRCAAWLLGVDVLDPEEHDLAPVLEVVSAGGKGPSNRTGLLGGKRDLRADEVVTLPNGVRTTGPLRTACDIGCLRGRYRAIATIDGFRRAYGLTVTDFDAILPRYRGRRGVIQLRELIALSADRVDSPPESWVRLMIHDDGLPMPAAQVDLVVPGWGEARLENAYEHLRIAVEYDGEQFHSRVEDRERDDARRAALDAAGWIVFVLRRGDLAAAQRVVWLRELGGALAARSLEPSYRRRYARGPSGTSYRWRARSR
ncbi:hypothetical protein F9L07_00835 [Pimelobacter simplex]|uniref:DUF559 domain-containing protein n=1 Tax=Nocardioides simplex TaxID=2045 RepID=A0A7J5DX32_NOCSI|nr:hypothetical protein [Pimelobacter simplex]KAB2810549.1 hypothetical protein F9L07_00835 [Pimelobacter simplex]